MPPVVLKLRVDNGCVRLASDDVGAGPAVVLLHAGVADRTMWAEHLDPIADAGYRVVAMDLPGFGETPMAQAQAPWSDVLETMDELHIERAVLVGNSFGGSVALSVAVLEPQRAAALVLVSAPAPGLEPSAELRAVWEAESSAMDRGDLEAAVAAVVDGWTMPEAPAALRLSVARMQRRALELQAAGDPTSEEPDPIEADPAALARLGIPALVIAGERELPDFRWSADVLARELRGAQHVLMAGAGHLAPIEQPVAFRELLLRFLAESEVHERRTR